MTSGGKKDPTYAEDVFSTYLYRVDGQTGRVISNGIKLSNANAGNSGNFDGTGEYKSSALEIRINENNGVYNAETVWSYTLPESYYGVISGNVQKLNNNNIYYDFNY